MDRFAFYFLTHSTHPRSTISIFMPAFMRPFASIVKSEKTEPRVSTTLIATPFIECRLVVSFHYSPVFSPRSSHRVPPHLEKGRRHLLRGDQGAESQELAVCGDQVHEESVRVDRSGQQPARDSGASVGSVREMRRAIIATNSKNKQK